MSRIEKDEGKKVETLNLFAQAHKMELNDYLETIADLMADIPDESGFVYSGLTQSAN
ncbi:MAG: hypothetical protein VKJ02_18675 [Snowella sp.]|nr:hypothetical protein [Snowella sp.]